MLLSEKLSTPESVNLTAEEQARADEASKHLALSQFSACPFCIKVCKEIARLGLNIETRYAQHSDGHRKALADGGGRILDRLAHPFGNLEFQQNVSCSLGIVLFSGTSITASELMRLSRRKRNSCSKTGKRYPWK